MLHDLDPSQGGREKSEKSEKSEKKVPLSPTKAPTSSSSPMSWIPFKSKPTGEEQEAGGPPLAWRLACRPDLSMCMALEPDAPMLSSVPSAFCPPYPGDVPGDLLLASGTNIPGFIPGFIPGGSKALLGVGGAGKGGGGGAVVQSPLLPPSPSSQLHSRLLGLGSTLAHTTRVQLGLGGGSQASLSFSDPESFAAALSKEGGEGEGEGGQGIGEGPIELNPDGSEPAVDVGDLAVRRG